MNDYCLREGQDKVICDVNQMPDDVRILIYEFCIDYTSNIKKKEKLMEEIQLTIFLVMFTVICFTIGILITGRISIAWFFINILLGYLVLLMICLSLFCVVCLPIEILTGFRLHQ